MGRRGAWSGLAVAVGILAASAAGLMVASGAGASPQGVGSRPAVAGPQAWARALPGFVKVRPGDDPAGTLSHQLSLARGECEGLQIYAAPPSLQVDARVEPLKGPGEAVAPRLYRVEYVEVRTPSNVEGETGLWPDPLIPVEDGYVGERRRALPWDSTAERPLVLYIEVCVPEAQAPGTYQGAIVVRARGRKDMRIPLTAQVQPFALPATSSLPTSFGISTFSLATGHKVDALTPEGRALLFRYGQAALKHRFSLHGMGIDPPATRIEKGQAVIDWSGYDQEVGPFLEGTALPGGARFTTTEVRQNPWLKTEAERLAYLRAFRRHFDHKGWTAQLFFYAKDEPKPEDVPRVLRESKEARSVGRLPVLVTHWLDETLTPAADIVSPTLNCFFERTGPQTCPKVTGLEALRRAVGPQKQIWWYQACNVHGCDSGPFGDRELDRAYSGWPSYMVDHPATLNRAMGVLGWLTGVDGELYFATVYAYNFRDPWTEGVHDFGGNGDGTLFYPGTPAKIGGRTHIPVESLRLKHLRDGLEDYEYLRALQALGAGDFARQKAKTLARSGYEIERDPAKWAEVRGELTARLRALWSADEYARKAPVEPAR
jgi:hypothetical protein